MKSGEACSGARQIHQALPYAAASAAAIFCATAPTDAFQQQVLQMLTEATELGIRYAHDTMPRGVLGLNARMFNDYMKFIADRRCGQIGLKALYPGAENPFPWMSEAINLPEEAFFEERPIEDQTGGALRFGD